MNKQSLFVSVIVPVFNGERFLAEGIESILKQNWEPLEIIIVDDGSTDGTAGIARGFGDKVRYVYQENSGPPKARNHALAWAKGNVIGFLDADDLWPEDKLKIQMTCLIEDPSVEISLGRLQVILMHGNIMKKPSSGQWKDPLPSMNLGSMIIRKSVFDKLGLFDESQFYADDVEWYFRARETGVRMVTHQDVTLLYRRHSGNLTNQRSVDNRYLLMAMKKSLDRRRKKKNDAGDSLPRWIEFDRYIHQDQGVKPPSKKTF